MELLNVENQNHVIRLTPAVKKLAERWGKHVDPEEAVGVALIALCDAVPLYSPEHGMGLDDFVTLSVRNVLQNWRRRQQYERRRGLAGGAATNREVLGLQHLDKTQKADVHGCYRNLDESLGAEDHAPELQSLWSELFAILPTDLRQIAYAKWVERMTHKEIASVLGVSQDAVDRRIKKAEGFAKLYLNGGAT